MSIADTQSNVQPPRDAQHVIAGLCLENDKDAEVSFQLTAEDYTSNEHIRLAAVLDSKLAFDRKYTHYAGEMRSYDFSGRRFRIFIGDVYDDELGITVYGVSLDSEGLQFGKDDFLLLVDVLEQEKAILRHMPALPSFKDLAAKYVGLENNKNTMMSFHLTAEDYTSNEHIRLAAVLDSKLAFDRKYTCYAGEMRSYDLSSRCFQILIHNVNDDEPGITVYGVSLDSWGLRFFGKDDFLLLVDVLEQEKAILQHMPALPCFKDLAAGDVLFDAKWVMEFACEVDFENKIDSRLCFVAKDDQIDEDRRMGVDIYTREMLIFGNKVQMEYIYDHCDYDGRVTVTGLKANATKQDDAFLDLVNLLVELQESEPIQRKLAVLMGLHPRLGQNSLFSTMDEDIACQIIAVADGA